MKTSLSQDWFFDSFRAVFRGDEAELRSSLAQNDEQFFDALVSHGMIPMLHNWISEHDFGDSISHSFKSSAKLEALNAAGASMLRREQTREAYSALVEAGVLPIVFKGVALAERYYSEPGLRVCCDVDMLIRKSDLPRARKVFEALGYVCDLTQLSGDYHRSQVSFRRSSRQPVAIEFDIHWLISNDNQRVSRLLTYEYLYPRCVGIKSLGEHAVGLNIVDSLALACCHRAGHFAEIGERLIWLYDVHLLTEAMRESEFAEFCDLVIRLGIAGASIDAIRSSTHWFNTDLTEQKRTLLDMLDAADESDELLSGDKASSLKYRSLSNLKQLPTLSERALYVFQQAFPSPEYMRSRYGVKSNLALPWSYIKRFFFGVYVLLKRGKKPDA